MTIILGIDPGSRITGYGMIKTEKNQHHYLDGGYIQVKGEDLSTRLHCIYDHIARLVQQYQPDTAAIEQVFMHRNPGSALKLGQARGAAILGAAVHGVAMAEYSARQVKQAVVGYGAADKAQVQTMVRCLLNLSELPQSDMADALAIAICHAHARVGLAKLTGEYQ